MIDLNTSKIELRVSNFHRYDFAMSDADLCTKETHIVVVIGGMNEPSNSNMLADAFIEGMIRVTGVRHKKFRLKDMNIEHFTLMHYDKHPKDHDDDFSKTVDELADCDGVVIATPVWNFGVPAHLKNFIDRMGSIGLDNETHSKGQFNAKPFYVIYTGGAPMIAWKALMYLTTLHITEAIKYYGGTVVGRHFEPRCVPGKGKFGLVVDKRPASLERARKNGERFAKIVMHYAENGSLPLRIKLGYQLCTFLYRAGNRIMYPISTLQ